MYPKSEYSHIAHVLESVEKKVDLLVTDINDIEINLKNVGDLSKTLKETVTEMSIVSQDLIQSCSALKSYFSYIEREYFPELEIKLINKIDASTNDEITTLTNTLSNNYNNLKKDILNDSNNLNNKLDKVLDILIKIDPPKNL